MNPPPLTTPASTDSPRPVGGRKPNPTSTGPRLPTGGSGNRAVSWKPTRSTTTAIGPMSPLSGRLQTERDGLDVDRAHVKIDGERSFQASRARQVKTADARDPRAGREL